MLIGHGAVVFIWKHDAVEWYYADLVDGVHYVSVTAETLLEKVASVDADSEMRRALRRGARGTQMGRFHAAIGAAQMRTLG